VGTFLLFMLLALGGSIGYLKYLGNKAMSPLYVDVRSLTAQQIIDIGTKASGSFVKRMAAPGGRIDRALGRPATRRTADGALEWDITSNAGVMTFQVAESAEGQGLRIAGFATAQRLNVRNSTAGGLWGFSSAMSDALMSALGVPRNPGRLIRQRRRVLKALESADASAPLSRSR
jgi:hypothetical protein